MQPKLPPDETIGQTVEPQTIEPENSEPQIGGTVFEPPTEATTEDTDSLWCLGVDLGTTEISAALLRLQTGQFYPIVWQETAPLDQPPLSGLPAIAYLSGTQLQHSPEVPIALGYQALESEFTIDTQLEAPEGLLLSNFKPLLKVGIPYWQEQTQQWQPMLQWSDQQRLALGWIQQALVALLKTLQGSVAGLTSTTPELSPEAFQAAIARISSVVIGCPTGWSDTYCFNLREAVLVTGLVDSAEQIYFVEDAIAALVGTLSDPSLSASQPSSAGTSYSHPQEPLQGGTLVMNAGATFTELLLVDVPLDRQWLTREHLYLRSLAYAGDAIDQDIICQILYPSAWNWDSLDLQSLDLPLPGEPDQEARDRLQQRLRSSDLGRHLLNAARQLKLALHHQDTATFKLNDQQWTVSQQDLHSRVMVPYLQQLNRDLNVLLNQSGIAVQSVQQVICTGRTTALPAIAYWLKQKLPNMRLIQAHDTSEAVSLIAQGLATLPLYPQMLDAVRHQYSDYFLLHELVRILPQEPLSVGRILQLLENQGINTNFCQRQILSLLEGHLPEGLLPSRATASLLVEVDQNADYQALAAKPLFSRESNQLYGFYPEMRDRLQHYLTAILTNAHQTLAEPLSIELGAEARDEG
ncbi:MAG: hypothetical protein KME45_04060 [Stenomitos rutilans HA7619-LM2]|nr:hypothetical protein [Stenomitos rutilans HA7619-LM2]